MSRNNDSFNLRSILEKDKLNNNNFLDWERNLRIVLKSEGMEDVLNTEIPVLAENATQAQKANEKRIRERSMPITCLMLAMMEPNLQKRFETMDAYSIIQNLRSMFQELASQERYITAKQLLDIKLLPGQKLHDHMFKMIGLFENLRRLGVNYGEEFANDIVLCSLHDGYKEFRLHY
ncbi:uncharacterized protein LOC110732208 [Chenopodium quinoa]|uniref:uncharacterized protein LOC110732208 n=1 Tax=Chenopodium quinoa TaxID=63459 RepID=UPI000B77470E|nr:uncharacterized protein LOC110732208 [Chenopodium quinoa]